MNFIKMPKGCWDRCDFMGVENDNVRSFSQKDLFECRISTVAPFALMLSPVYVYMKLNEKMVSVKAPLDFFTPEELVQLSRYEVFYIPKAIRAGSRFQTAAKLVRNLLSGSLHRDAFLPSTFELSNEVLFSLVPLWGRQLSVDAFFCAVFTDELCGSLRPEKLLEARETEVVRHESGILLSSLVVFVLLHLGYLDLRLLCEIRKTIYEGIVDLDETFEEPKFEWSVVARDLRKVLEQQSVFSIESLAGSQCDWVLKFRSRIDRIKRVPNLTIYPSLFVTESEASSG